MVKTPRKAEPVERKVWFNWPLVVGLILNFVVLALVASCAVHLVHSFTGGSAAHAQ